MEPSIQKDMPLYSLRRCYVDAFCFRHIAHLPPGSRVLDLGGDRVSKRGRFDIGRYDLRVVYANLTAAKQPHVQADANAVPFRGGCFDAVVCSELLEHVPDPLPVLRDAHRVLRVQGSLFVCVPFLFPLHPDPFDYGRYTDRYWNEQLARCGFESIEIEKQGLFWSVAADMLRSYALSMDRQGRIQRLAARFLLKKMAGWAMRTALARDARTESQQHPLMGRFVQGFGISAKKASPARGAQKTSGTPAEDRLQA